MTVVATYLAVTLVLGLFAVVVRLPPLVGFLAAGFVLNWMHVEHLPAIEVVADLGLGDAEATIRTTDLSHAYVEENSAYSS